MTAARIARAGPILALIRRHESDPAVAAQGVESAYDVVWGGIRREDRPKKLSALPISRVLWWQDLIDPRYMSEAAGAYQIMEDTLRGLDFDPDAIFDEATQDALAMQLLDRRKWADCEAGRITVEAFADNLAREWASLPVVRDQKGASRAVKRGQSYYSGDGLNKAHATPEEVLSAIRSALAASPSASIPNPATGLTLEEMAALRALSTWAGNKPAAFDEVAAWIHAMPKDAA